MGLSFKHGLALGLLIPLGCASVPFPYKYYALEAKDYAGTLVGAKPADDLDFTICTPTPQDQRPCVVVKREEFMRLKGDFKTLEDELRACQAPKVATGAEQ